MPRQAKGGGLCPDRLRGVCPDRLRGGGMPRQAKGGGYAQTG